MRERNKSLKSMEARLKKGELRVNPLAATPKNKNIDLKIV